MLPLEPGRGARGGNGQFLESGTENAAKIAVGIIREYGGLYDDANHDAEKDLLDAGQCISPRIVRISHPVGRHHDIGQSGKEKSVRRAGLSKERNAHGDDKKSAGKIEERRLLPRSRGEVGQDAAEDRADEPQDGFFLHRTDVTREQEHNHGENRPRGILQPQDLGEKEGRHAGKSHLQSECRRAWIERGPHAPGERLLANRFHVTDGAVRVGLRPRQKPAHDS